MNNIKQHVREEWTPRPGKQLLKSFLGVLVVIITAWLGFNVHFLAGAAFFLGCFIVSICADRPRRIQDT